ncbi:MAG TPA: alpha/beta fold hydrolase [Pyrinomonadaceae bacterium]|nr:alpha/beta fold hydrolase [Pyrinomonadaceae bacterium]
METITDSGWAGGSRRARGGDCAHVPSQALSERLAEVARAFRSKPFRPHPLLRGGHAQTIVAALRHERYRPWRSPNGLPFEPRLLEVEPGARVLLKCLWQDERERAPALLLIHGLEGSSDSPYILGTARRAFARGFNVACLNMRTCGGTEHLTPTLYHSGMTGDIAAAVSELASRDRVRRIYVAGFSMSGNMVLKLAGDYGGAAPEELAGVCAVSPSIDLSGCADRIELRSNAVYRASFMRSLRGRMRRKQRLHPELYDVRGLRRVRTIRQFDDRYTARHGGYGDASSYYERASSLGVIPRIRTPTLIIHAEDDPIIPAEPFRSPSITDNPDVLLVLTSRGGHVGFLSGDPAGDERHWAEQRVAEFCEMLERQNSGDHLTK